MGIFTGSPRVVALPKLLSSNCHRHPNDLDDGNEEKAELETRRNVGGCGGGDTYFAGPKVIEGVQKSGVLDAIQQSRNQYQSARRQPKVSVFSQPRRPAAIAALPNNAPSTA